MITEDQFEQRFQETSWNYQSGAGLAPKGVTPEWADFRVVVLKACLARAVQRLNPSYGPRKRANLRMLSRRRRKRAFGAKTAHSTDC
jgi:hypothetical protein